MFNWKKVSLILLASAALLSGCTQSNIVSPADGKIQGDGQPDTEIDKDIKIDWEEVRSDLEEQYLEPYGAFADYVMDLNVVYDDEQRQFLFKLQHRQRGCAAGREFERHGAGDDYSGYH